MLVGRNTERAAIDGLLGGARGGSSGVLVLRGAAGIGKSALLDYAAARAQEMTISRVTGVESEIALGFAAVHQLVLPFLRHVGDLPEPQRQALESVFGFADHGTTDPLQVSLAVLTLLDDIARERPMLLVVDDAHWLDDESARVLIFVARRLHADRIAMIFAVRDTEIAGGSPFEALPQLAVVPMPERDARKMLEHVAGPVDTKVADRLVRETRGNPLALLEFLAELSNEQLAGEIPLPQPLPVGRPLQEQFAARARRLPPAARTVLLLTSAERFGDPALLHRAADAMAVRWDDAVAAIEAADFASFDRTVTFRHPLIRSAAYHGATSSERRQAHRALADALDGDEDVDRRAWHLAAAAADPDERIAQELERSAGRALQRGGTVAAADLLERASELTPDAARRTDRLLEAVRLRAAGGNLAGAQNLLERVLTGVHDVRQRADAEWTQGLIWLEAGRGDDAMRALARAVASMEGYDRGFPLDALITAEFALLYAGSLRDESLARDIATTAIRLLPPDDASLTASELLVRGMAIALTDGYVAAADPIRAALARIREEADDCHVTRTFDAREHANGLDLLAVSAAAALLDDAALHAVARSWVEFGRRARTLSTLPIALDLMAVAHVLAGRLRSAEAAIAEAEDILSFAGTRGLIGDPGLGELFLYAYRGDEAQTRDAAQRKTRSARERGAGIDLDHAHYALAVLELGCGRYPAALEHCRKVAPDDTNSVSMLIAPVLLEAAVRCDEREAADVALGWFAERATASGSNWAEGLLSCMRAVLAGDDGAEQHYSTALDRLSCCSAAFDHARAKLLYGEWLRRARRRREAREPLRDALDFFDDVGARAFADRARHELTATGERSRPRSDDKRDVLTPQEAKISELVVQGRSNGEIASQLFISKSTVEYHLHKIYRKLGVSSRTQLAACWPSQFA